MRYTIDDYGTGHGFIETDGDGQFRAVSLFNVKAADQSSRLAKSFPGGGTTGDQSMNKGPMAISEDDRLNNKTADLAVGSQWFKFEPKGSVVPLEDSITQGFPTVIAEPAATTPFSVETLFEQNDDDTHLIPGKTVKTSAGGKGHRRRRLAAAFHRLGGSRASRSGGGKGSDGGGRE